ncbi:MAG: CoA pyrophosphatase [Pseudomonadales bacterium]|nr:CoA pyrophosphatase [Pseudomonadales bacterium]
MSRFERRARPDEGHKPAAVAMVLVDGAYGAELSGMPVYDEWQNSACLVLTRRSSKLRDHPGQWALPGGRVDEGETLEQTALRELHEEVGLVLKTEQVIGRLDDFITRSGYVMTPVVIWAGPTENMVANEEEVDSIHRIPLSEFMRSDAPLLSYDELDDQEAESEGSQQVSIVAKPESHPVLRMPVGDGSIAAPTAALLYQFIEVCIQGRATRVGHYEQPVFAWK